MLSVRLARAAAACALGALSLLALAGPASAHATPANYRSAITAVTPRMAGLTVTAAADGSYLRVRNTSVTPVVVEGYQHEPYLRVSAAGVWQNDRSPATYLNRESAVGNVPDSADAKATPVWTRISTKPVTQWHDHRIHWMGDGRPAVVDRAPASPHLIARWTVPMDTVNTGGAAGTAIAVRGTLRWEPGSAASRWLGYGFVLVGLGGAALVGVVLWRRQRRLVTPVAITPAGVPERV
jgi:hypothetical protein